MTTLSWTTTATTCNVCLARETAPDAPAAPSPSVRAWHDGGVVVLCDPHGPGIAANAHGLIVIELTGSSWLSAVDGLATAESADDVEHVLRTSALAQPDVAIAAIAPGRRRAWRRTGRSIVAADLPDAGSLSDALTAPHATAFRRLREYGLSGMALLRAFHASHANPGDAGPCRHDPVASTTGLTTVVTGFGSVELTHQHGSPCLGSPAAPYRLERRRAKRAA